MRKKLKLGKYDKQHEVEIRQLLNDVCTFIEPFYKKREISLISATYDSVKGSTSVRFEVDEPERYYPAFQFYLNVGTQSLNVPPSKKIFVATFTMMNVSQEYQFELREKYGVFSQIGVADGSADGTTAEKLQYIFDKAADRLAVWDGHMVAADIFLF
jgi:hypothetical protein